jgi:hypothetical protein
MYYAADNNEDLGAALAFLGLAPIFLVFLAWLITAFVAGLIAQDRGRSFGGFFFATLFFLGPLGVGVALLATRAGLAAAAANGRKGGRPRKVDDADAAKARSLREKGIAATDIARMLGVSRATVYRYLADEAA